MKPLKQVSDLIPYVPGKPVEELERELGITGSIKIASNENPIGPSKLAIDAVVKYLKEINRYPDGDCFYLKRKLAENLGIKESNLIIGNGSNEVIEIITRTYLSENDEAIYGEHAFIVYPIVTQSVGAKHVVSSMPDLVHNLDDFASKITNKTKIIYLANPNNPTGTIFKKIEFEKFLDRVPDNVIVIVDEAYFEYVDEPDYPDSLVYHGSRKNIITVRTFSKIYGLAGLRIGYGIGSEEIISYVNRVREPFNVNSLAQVAAVNALDDSEHIKNTKSVNKTGLRYLMDQLDEIGIKYTPSFTNFILIDLEDNPIPVYNNLLKEGVIVRPVGGYGLKSHLRVSVGLGSENERFISALKKVLNK
jgi:histidinol-phosphate aminotransferase